MLAADTNVLVRYLTADHPVQSARARALIASQDVYVSATVLLESEWVLRSSYGYTGTAIAEAFRILAGSPRIRVEDPAIVSQALEWLASGMDFADALHLAQAGGCDAFITFDRDLIRTAGRIAAVPVRAP